ncbi:MAG TPA: diphosphomevalonate decarboxylase [Kiritimatiellia bacterium]|nr:diphosphomevalonate decarboxylase [Kiritimatiellia bacterium]
MKRDEVVAEILKERGKEPAGEQGEGYAPANIALCKYWGKRNGELNLPVTSSLSVSLGHLGTRTVVGWSESGEDEVVLNGGVVERETGFYQRLSKYLDLFRFVPEWRFRVVTENTVPTAAGLASSASGFAAMAKALDGWFGWGLETREVSILARLGSGSAARSVVTGFVEWHAGGREDGMDSFAEPLEVSWPEFRIGWIKISTAAKSLSSREGMERTVKTSRLYEVWPEQVREDLVELKRGLGARDLEAVGRIAESNALTMHATSLGAWPPVLYWLPESVAAIHQVHGLRREGIPVFLTMDAGPNVKVLFEEKTGEALKRAFPGLECIAPG